MNALDEARKVLNNPIQPGTDVTLIQLAHARATLELAEQQRLANLISIWQDPSLAPGGAAHGEFRTNIRSQILEAMYP